MGDNATISPLRSTIMSNVSCCYPAIHQIIACIALDQRLDVTSVTYLTQMPLLYPYLYILTRVPFTRHAAEIFEIIVGTYFEIADSFERGQYFFHVPHANTEFGLTVGRYNFRTRWPLNDDMERWGVFRVGQSLLYIPQAPTTQSHPEPPIHLTLILGRGNRNEAKSITAVRSRPDYFFAKKQGASNSAWYATRFQKSKKIARNLKMKYIWHFFSSNMNTTQKCDTA